MYGTLYVDDIEVTLEELEKGSLFKFGNSICMKTEYVTQSGTIEAYIVGSGEFFWGGTSDVKERRKLKVRKVTIE